MEELLIGLAVVDHLNGGRGMRAIYERACDEPRRPVRRLLASMLRALAARLSPPLVAGESLPVAERPASA